MNYKEHIRVIPDFPQPGIRFKDITTLTNNGAVYAAAINDIKQAIQDKQIDLIAGPEARGFIIGAPLAVSMGLGFVPIRKSGKLPGEVVEASYDLEYGKDKLTIHKDAIKPGQKVLIADDLLATGGTIATTINLIEQLGGEVVGAAFLIELGYLDGRSKLGGIDIFSLVTY
ncbi:adenine phosphoribosyltransferase [Paenibacillus glycinis]|uniref:Adenine phosphoribosyltransferase n=1 Tax=Paenibacillus glycinis TaxID=2697035 RepID=A0ABW9XTE5_9BACL|nr:adenine phosphoribosyltransferase [Paenibacillus glycinis]NBD25951.1 adenine phosphoribosyltransferase [Paenibacillus glycinis]